MRRTASEILSDIKDLKIRVANLNYSSMVTISSEARKLLDHARTIPDLAASNKSDLGTLMHIGLPPIITRLHRALKAKAKGGESVTEMDLELLQFCVYLHNELANGGAWTLEPAPVNQQLNPRAFDEVSGARSGWVVETIVPSIPQVSALRGLVKVTARRPQ
jgi:hypothetical protein